MAMTLPATLDRREDGRLCNFAQCTYATVWYKSRLSGLLLSRWGLWGREGVGAREGKVCAWWSVAPV